MVRYVISLCLFLFAFSAHSAINTAPVPAFSFGAQVGTSAAQGPMLFVNDVTKYYSVQCGPGAGNNATSGNYYKCFKQGGGGGDWSVASTKTAYCPGFYIGSNLNTAAYVIFGYGTAAVTNASSSDPSGVVSFASNGYSAGFAASSSYVPVWMSYPVFFPGASATGGPGATIYPWIKSGISGGSLGVIFICTDL